MSLRKIILDVNEMASSTSEMLICIMKSATAKSIILRFFIIILLGTLYQANAQQPLILTKEQATEDFRWLRFALEYVHPRLYKYDHKKTVDARFDSLNRQIKKDISGLDFLALVSTTNAAVRCGHLYTIPQGQLADEVLNKKILPFHVKVLDQKL
jgi:hypothetical protein